MKRRFLGQQRPRRVGHDILDPDIRMPVALADGITVRFPAHWSARVREAWRSVYVREEWMKARGKA